LFKPTYTKVDHKTGRKVSRKSRKWYVKYCDADGIVQRVPGFTDKEATRQLAAELERKVAHRQAGLVDPYEDHRGRPLDDHLADYERHLAAKNDSPKHIKLTVNRIRAALDGCRFRKIADLSASRLAQWLADSRRDGMAVATSNYYLTAVRGFSRWLVRDRRAGEDPLAHLSTGNVKVDRRHDRRSISDAEFARLIEAAAAGEPFRGLSGRDRAILYLTAAYTGLRASELASLTPSSFDLGSRPPSLTVEAAYSKHRRRDVLPLRSDLAALLGDYLRERPVGSPVWPGTWVERAAQMVRDDLAKAKIPYQDASGRFFDFHALRHQFISKLAMSGVSVKAAQALARHSTVTLTMDRYAHAGLKDTAEALALLPGLPGAPTAAKGADPGARPAEELVPGLVPAGDVSCREPSSPGSDISEDIDVGTCPKSMSFMEFGATCHQVTLLDMSSGGGTRTPDTRIMIPRHDLRAARRNRVALNPVRLV
jgi:integrase